VNYVITLSDGGTDITNAYRAVVESGALVLSTADGTIAYAARQWTRCRPEAVEITRTPPPAPPPPPPGRPFA
jgi:hypothetical protein